MPFYHILLLLLLLFPLMVNMLIISI